MKEKRYVPFVDVCEDEFIEHIEDIKKYLLKEDLEYKKIYLENEKIIDSSNSIQEIICGNSSVESLSKEEIKSISICIKNYLDMERIVLKEMYFKGGMDAYYYFKKIGILK